MSKTNAKQEFLLHTRQVLASNPKAQIICCAITRRDNHSSWEEEQKGDLSAYNWVYSGRIRTILRKD